MTHVHVHSMHTHRLQEYTYCSPSDGIGPYTVGPNDKATKKVQRTEAFARRCASFFGRGRFSLGSFVRPFVRGRPHSSHKTSYIKLELRLETP